MSQLICKDLTLGYDGQTVLKDVNFTIDQGDYLCVVGENGSGKSTLMKTLLHLNLPMGGEIIWDDGLRPGAIGYLPQQTVVQRDFPASVWEIVLSGCLNQTGFRPFYSKEEKQRAADALQKLNIENLTKRCYRELSGGQQQRVLLARALCATSKMLLLDEPVSGLDPTATTEMYALIEALNKEGTTILMISHDMNAAITYASHILHVGSPLFFGTRTQYLSSELGKLYAKEAVQ